MSASAGQILHVGHFTENQQNETLRLMMQQTSHLNNEVYLFIIAAHVSCPRNTGL